MEGIIEQSDNVVTNLLPKTKPKKEKILDFNFEVKEIPIESNKNYIIRVGLGGPQGYYGTGLSRSHFGLADYDKKIVKLFSIL